MRRNGSLVHPGEHSPSGLRARLQASRLMRAAVAVAAVASVSAAGGVATASAAGNPCTGTPTPAGTVPANPFGANVTIFDPSMSVSSINAALNATPPAGGKRQFFFLPGTYGDASVTPSTATTSNVIQAQVASGTVVAGLGTGPCDVVINGAIDVFNQCAATCEALNNFWRSLSNLTINPTKSADCRSQTEFWAVSQAAPMRRVQKRSLDVAPHDR